MARLVENVFVTEGTPQETFVEPPNYNQILIDVRNVGKPVIVEGQSGTGKTTTIRKILERLGTDGAYEYLTARKPRDREKINDIANNPTAGVFIIDDFHRLPDEQQTKLADIAKLAAEESSSIPLPKLVLIGINQVGSGLIQLVPDITKRIGIHRILPADLSKTMSLIGTGCEVLNIEFDNKEQIFSESRGDYWLTQQLCQTACTHANILEEVQGTRRKIRFDVVELRRQIVEKLHSAYNPAIKDFCRGRRFRPSNDPYYKLLKAVAEYGESNVDLTMLANAFPNIKTSINNIKDRRLTILLDDKPLSGKYFYYNVETTQFSIEDPAVFYYLRHLDWAQLRIDCGFRDSTDREYEFDVAISFAGENRKLAKHIASQLELLDVRVFYDEAFEANYLGKVWTEQFKRIFGTDSRFVVCLLDENHKKKIWPTFERECFTPRVAEADVLPIYLDDTVFLGIPSDIVGIKFKFDPDSDGWQADADTKIVYKILDRIG